MFQPHYSGLIAISSFRPNASPDIAANQLRAKQSWDAVFDHIYLFGPPDKQLASPRTEFIPCENWPSISLLLAVASWQQDPVCILNADIVVASHLKDSLNRGWGRRAMALTSRRYEFDPAAPDYDRAQVVDMGADFFCAFPQVWKLAYSKIPKQLRIGHQRWDQWILCHLWQQYPQRFWDITYARAIFHPRHGERHMPHHISISESEFPPSYGFPPVLT